VILNLIFGFLALLSLALTLWQWLVARRFPLHQRVAEPSSPPDPRSSRREESLAASPQPSTLNPQPPLTLLKPLKGCDPATECCLRSWLAQQYAGPVQILFGVAAADDPVCGIVRKLLQEFPAADAQLVLGTPPPGANAKVAKLAELERLARHDLLVISDADVLVPPDLLANVVAPLCAAPLSNRMGEGSGVRTCGLVCCFYRLANPTTLAMQWEAIAINADFWSQVLQSRSLKPIDFALGAVMATRRQQLQEIGGFAGLVDCLADDYQLGNRIARRGHSIDLSPVVVDCWSAPMGWTDVWKHQLRWARTIRVCQPAPYFFSLLSNATLWPLLWLSVKPAAPVAACATFCWLVRILTALDFQRRLGQEPSPGGRASPGAPSDRTPQAPAQAPWHYAWLIPLKDLLQAAIWLLAFLGNRIEWRGQEMRLRRDGTLEQLNRPM
jgi:ceramide glucosyltransferase